MKRDRMRRVDEVMRREIGVLVERTVASEVSVLVTVTQVKTSPDLRHATVFFSVLGGDNDPQPVLEALRRWRGEFQKEIARRVQMKYTPVLRFKFDDNPEKADHLLGILGELDLADTPEVSPIPDPEEDDFS